MKVLLINPWIYDFAAFDLWSKPLGLLYIGSFLEHHGHSPRLIDCLDRAHPSVINSTKERKFTTGKFRSEKVLKPDALNNIPRSYKRYGISIPTFLDQLKKEQPEIIIMTSGMTYWYPGVFEAIRLCKKVYPDVPVILGGIYATLLPEHARTHSRADKVITGNSMLEILRTLGIDTQGDKEPTLEDHPFPAYHLYPEIRSISMITSLGCPNRCTYCASQYIQPHFQERSPESILREIVFYSEKYSVHDIAFYDDALLINASKRFLPLAQGLTATNLNLNFHTPNGIGVRDISSEVAQALFQTGFKTLRLSFESTSQRIQQASSGKTTNRDLEKARDNLINAGYLTKNIEVYILAGLPQQDTKELLGTIHYVHSLGLTIKLALYSPIPGTVEYKNARTLYPFIEDDPLFHNNTVYSYRTSEIDYRNLHKAQLLVKTLNQQ